MFELYEIHDHFTSDTTGSLITLTVQEHLLYDIFVRIPTARLVVCTSSNMFWTLVVYFSSARIYTLLRCAAIYS